MPAASQLLRELEGLGFQLRPRGDRLIVRPIPGQQLPPERAEHIKALHAELLSLVRMREFRAEMQRQLDAINDLLTGDELPEPTLRLVAAQAELDRADPERGFTAAMLALRTWGGLWRQHLTKRRSEP